MKCRQSIYFVFIALVSLNSCKRFKKTNNEGLLTAVVNKYPQLTDSIGDPSNYYKWIKTVIIPSPEVTLQLFVSKKSDNQIVILRNSTGAGYAIPLFGNQYKSYWQFPFDSPTQAKLTPQTTFEKVLNQALDTLQLNNGRDGDVVINEIFSSLSSYRELNEADTSLLKMTYIKNNGLPDDNEDTCNKRSTLNRKMIIGKMLLYDKNYKTIFTTPYLDEDNNRIFQVEFPNSGKRVKNYYHILVYRFGCVVHPIEL